MVVHPEQYKVEVIQPDGTKFFVMSTNSNGGKPIECSVAPCNHPAWKKKDDASDSSYLESKKNVANFRRRYGSYGGGRLSKPAGK